MREQIQREMRKILETGSAGIIGSNLELRLLKGEFQGEPVHVVGLDNLNNYYDSSLKNDRLSVILSEAKNLKDIVSWEYMKNR